MARLNFKSDLVESIINRFDQLGIQYNRSRRDPHSLAMQYFDVRSRMIPLKSYTVHFSVELGNKLTSTDSEWAALVDQIKYCFENSQCVLKFASKNMFNANFNDELFNDYGIHHFHLSNTNNENDSFVDRSDCLLFAIVRTEDVYFVDIGRHPNDNLSDDYGWVRQELLAIINSNWPEIIEPHVVPGATGSIITDKEKKELRRKNINVMPEIGGHAIASIGWGVTYAGRNIICVVRADKLLQEIETSERYLETQPAEVKAALKDKGLDMTADMEFRLKLLDNHDERSQLLEGNLAGSGWGILETTSGILVDLNLIPLGDG